MTAHGTTLLLNVRVHWVTDILSHLFLSRFTNSTRKTSIAIGFCYRRHKAHPQAHTFWLHADSHETFNDSYLELRRRAKLLRDDDPDEKRPLERVEEWLESSASGDWTIIIDNFDEADSYLAKHLPLQGGVILYATRDRRLIGNAQYVPSGAGVNTDAMSDKEALEMFTKVLAADASAALMDTEDAHELLGRLERLPLAIAQAAAFTKETGVAILEYLEAFSKCDSE